MAKTVSSIAALILTLGGAQALAQPAGPPDAGQGGFQGFGGSEEKKELPLEEADGGAPKGGYEGWADSTSPMRRSPTDPDATDPRFIKPGRFGPVAFASTTSAIIFAYIPSYAWVVGLGVGFTYDPNGLPGPTGPTPDKFSGVILALVEYMLINEGPFAFGPEIFFQGSMAPGGFFSRRTIAAGVTWWYAPWWNAPVLIGGAWHLKLTSVYGLAPIFELETPSVRFGFLWR